MNHQSLLSSEKIVKTRSFRTGVRASVSSGPLAQTAILVIRNADQLALRSRNEIPGQARVYHFHVIQENQVQQCNFLSHADTLVCFNRVWEKKLHCCT